MPKQMGLLPLSGKMQHVVYYRSKGKNLSRSAPKAYRFSEASIQSRIPFGLGSRMGKHLKSCFAAILDDYKYEGIHNRLAEACRHIYRQEPVLAPQSTWFRDYPIKLLEGFEFNRHRALADLLKKDPIQMEINPDGQVRLEVMSHEPSECFYTNDKTTAISLRFLFCLLDHEEASFSIFQPKDLLIPLNEKPFDRKSVAFALENMNNKMLFYCLQFRYHLNGSSLPSLNKRMVAARILRVEYIRDHEFVSYPLPVVQERQPTLSNNRQQDLPDWT